MCISSPDALLEVRDVPFAASASEEASAVSAQLFSHHEAEVDAGSSTVVSAGNDTAHTATGVVPIHSSVVAGAVTASDLHAGLPALGRPFEVLDSCQGVRAAMRRLRTHGGPVAIDLEGLNLGHSGKLCLIQAAALTGPVYLVDVLACGPSLFQEGVKQLLEDESIPKLMFDVRMDADILLHQYAVRLAGVLDLQVLSCTGESCGEMKFLMGLDKVVEKLLLASEERSRFKAIKEAGRELFASSDFWLRRPLSETLKQYAASDVEVLFYIYRQWGRAMRKTLLADISRKRMYSREVQVDSQVRLVHMPIRDLNGEVGTIQRWAPDAGGRWIVQRKSNGEELHVRPENVVLVADAQRDFPLPYELRTVCVRGLGPQATEEALLRHFQRFGRVSEVQMRVTSLGPGGQLQTGFANVHFQLEQSARAALLEANHPPLGPGGSAVKVDWPEHVRRFCPRYLDFPPDRRFHGKVKSINPDRSFGIVSCAALHKEVRATDVLMNASQVANLVVGQQVSFSMFLNERGQPQAKEVLPHVREEPTDEVYFGCIKCFYVDKGFGFIKCDKSFAIYGLDVFLHAKQIGTCTVGQEVFFRIELNAKRQPQALDVTPSVSPGRDPRERQRFVGCVRNLFPDRGFGFIKCDETQQKFGKDVYLNSSTICNVEIGQVVSFTIGLNSRQQPQAQEVEIIPSPKLSLAMLQ